MTGNTLKHAPGTDHPSASGASSPAPEAVPAAPVAEGGKCGPGRAPAPGVPAAPDSRPVQPGHPDSSATETAPPAPARRAGRPNYPPASESRTAPAADPHSGGRGTQTGGESRDRTAGPQQGRGPVVASPPDPGGSESGRGRRGRQGAVAAPPITGPEGAARRQTAAAPSGSTPLRGEDFRRAVREAQSKAAAEKRRGRGRYPVKRQGSGYRPGGARRMPPPIGGDAA